jgi:hypothetical protein
MLSGISGRRMGAKGRRAVALDSIGVTVRICALQATSNFLTVAHVNRAEIIAGLRGGLANECSDATDLIEHLHLAN